MNKTIREYFRSIEPKAFGHKNIKVRSVSRLGMGESNLSYLVRTDRGNYVVRINMDPTSPKKSRREYNSLRAVEGKGIAPKAFFLDESKIPISDTLIVLEYLPGRTLEDEPLSVDLAKRLGKLIGELHTTKIGRKKLASERTTYTSYLTYINSKMRFIKKSRYRYGLGDEFYDMVNETLVELKSMIRHMHCKPKKVIGHGDLCQQNILTYRGKLKLIDFESFGFIDPAAEIAIIFEDFGKNFRKNHRDAFLNAYKRYNDDPELENRISLYIPLKLFEVFIWAVMHVYEIGEHIFDDSFIVHQDIKKHIKYAEYCFERCVAKGVISEEWAEDPPVLFPDVYL